ncbi:aldose epimerase family protein [uncultured Oscillibacter sp.]|uniref:aldose epimerase family protein n=1 Tax=uncultured Oscillibacter sp. TaxID=876091 RepID=UPI002806437D|nr:aldose epimerase family protein [uncultured Oscillibacter sp.]
MKETFGILPDGTAVDQYTLSCGDMVCQILTYGGALRSLRVPDRRGAPVDVLLGFDSLADYCAQDKYIGALIGRCANRIGGSRFILNGVEYPLAANDGPNHLHGGVRGFDKQVWRAVGSTPDTLVLALRSPDGQEGYPGNLDAQVTYRLSGGALSIAYRAVCDRDTPCNLTSHAYFNLGGHGSGPVTDQTMQIFADRYTPTDARSIPTGAVESVAGTPMDLRRPAAVGRNADGDFFQLAAAGGYDHNWITAEGPGPLHPAARAVCPATGISMEVATTLPGIQFYSGNYLDGCPAGKGGAPYAKRWGFCLETQFFPDTPSRPDFPSCILHPGEIWQHTTVFQFGLCGAGERPC